MTKLVLECTRQFQGHFQIYIWFCLFHLRLQQKQLSFILGRQQIFLELNDEMDEYDDLVEIMSNSQLNHHFLALAREVWL